MLDRRQSSSDMSPLRLQSAPLDVRSNIRCAGKVEHGSLQCSLTSPTLLRTGEMFSCLIGLDLVRTCCEARDEYLDGTCRFEMA